MICLIDINQIEEEPEIILQDFVGFWLAYETHPSAHIGIRVC
jgi:hypothetical protein